jgi:hypothetical protein
VQLRRTGGVEVACHLYPADEQPADQQPSGQEAQ